MHIHDVYSTSLVIIFQNQIQLQTASSCKQYMDTIDALVAGCGANIIIMTEYRS